MKKLRSNIPIRSLFSQKFRIERKKKWIIIAGILLLVICYLLFVLTNDIPSLRKLLRYEIPQTTKILDRKGLLLYDIYTEQNRTLVKLQDVPQYLKEATIAIEDKDFYRHGGIDPVGGILRAAKETILHHR